MMRSLDVIDWKLELAVCSSQVGEICQQGNLAVSKYFWICGHKNASYRECLFLLVCLSWVGCLHGTFASGASHASKSPFWLLPPLLSPSKQMSLTLRALDTVRKVGVVRFSSSGMRATSAYLSLFEKYYTSISLFFLASE